jgi:hypothetical protein
MAKIDEVKRFFEYRTSKFWIAVAIVVILHFIPIGESYIGMLMFVALWKETGSIFFLMGMIALELFVVILVPLVSVQRFLLECDFE